MSHRNSRMNRAAAALLILAALGAASAGCKKKTQAERAAAPPAATVDNSLGGRLNAMPAQAQIDTMRTLVKADSTDAQMRFFSGNAYYSFATGLDASAPNRSAYYDSADAQYQAAVDLDSTMSKAWVNMGLALADAGKRPQARKAMEKAIEINPNDVLAYCHLGYLDHVTGNLSEAMAMYKQALSIDPNSAQAHYNLGLAFAEQKIFNEAVREWQIVIKNDPDSDLGKTAAENVRIIAQYNSK